MYCNTPIFCCAGITAASVVRVAVRIVVLVMLCGIAAVAAQDNATWVLIDTGSRSLTVLQGDTVKQTYRNISIGRGGVTQAKRRRDGKTPLGEFRITRMTTDTPFHRFFGLDFPNVAHARQGLAAGIIDKSQYAAIRRAVEARQTPPQQTPLGGYIGIHGIGQGNPAVHEDFNWTHGCVALTNAQIDVLFRWVRVGTKVIIRR